MPSAEVLLELPDSCPERRNSFGIINQPEWIQYDSTTGTEWCMICIVGDPRYKWLCHGGFDEQRWAEKTDHDADPLFVGARGEEEKGLYHIHVNRYILFGNMFQMWHCCLSDLLDLLLVLAGSKDAHFRIALCLNTSRHGTKQA